MTATAGLSVDGWMSAAQRIDSPNNDDRPAGEAISLVVVHAISLPPAQFGSDDIARLFTNSLDPEAHPYFSAISPLRVSAHFLIRRDGELIQFVSCQKRAWHVGVSTWKGRQSCNDFSIGIELEGSDFVPFADIQYQQLINIIEALLATYPQLSRQHITGHENIAPGRKTDPGVFFNWQRLSKQFGVNLPT